MKNKDFESIASAAPGLNRAVRFAFTTENWLICCDMGTTLCWQCTHEKHEYENMLFRFLFGSKRGEIGLITRFGPVISRRPAPAEAKFTPFNRCFRR